MNLKQLLLGTPLGRFAMSFRESSDLLRTAIAQPETLGTVANDQLAGLLLTSLCESGKTFLDVGAHIGSVIAAVKAHDSKVDIVAVEAIPEKAAQLRRKFPDVEIHACAVGEQEGEAAFFVDTRRSGYSSLLPQQGGSAPTLEIKVVIKRLDDLIPVNSEVDVIKIDIEGAEVGALRGATEIVWRCRPTVLFESGPAREGSKYEIGDIFEYFHQHDYVIVVPNRLAHNDGGLTVEGFLESHLYPRRTTNYFAVPKARRIEIRDKARRICGINPE